MLHRVRLVVGDLDIERLLESQQQLKGIQRIGASDASWSQAGCVIVATS